MLSVVFMSGTVLTGGRGATSGEAPYGTVIRVHGTYTSRAVVISVDTTGLELLGMTLLMGLPSGRPPRAHSADAVCADTESGALWRPNWNVPPLNRNCADTNSECADVKSECDVS